MNSSNALLKSWKILSVHERKKMSGIVVFQVLLSFMDLVGVFLVGMVAASAFGKIDEGTTLDLRFNILDLLHLNKTPVKYQTLILGLIASLFLIGRTLASILITRHILFYFSRKGAEISNSLVSRFLAQPLLVIQSRTSQDIVYSLTRGVEAISIGVLGSSIVLVADIALLVIMSLALFFVDFGIATGTVLLFATVAFFLQRLMSGKAGRLGVELSSLNIESNEKIVEALGSYREIVVRNRRYYYAQEINRIRAALSVTLAETHFLPFVSKYVIESSVVIGALVLSAVQFLFQDAVQAISTLGIFLAAGTRIAPAVLRIQQGSVQIRNGLGAAEPTLELIEALSSAQHLEVVGGELDTNHGEFVPEIEIDNVTFTYPNSTRPAICEATLLVPAGCLVAVVGPSGAGKTTLVDVILGIISPDIGTIKISGLTPHAAISRWPGSISYVPQDVLIAGGTIRSNVAMGYPQELDNEFRIMEALNAAQLGSNNFKEPLDIDFEVGERGSKLSGGQRQRLGIARALFTKPKLLVLDEATSALDAQTEEILSTAIQLLKGSTTVILIAHRLSTVRSADLVVYIDNGKIISAGTFEQVREAVLDFDYQSRLMGL